MINEEKRWEKVSQQLILILETPWKKKGHGNWFRKENVSPPISGTSFADNSWSILDIYSSL